MTATGEENAHEIEIMPEVSDGQTKNEPSIEPLPTPSHKTSPAPFYMSYQQFVGRLEGKNNGVIERERAEKLWKVSCEDIYNKWKPDAEISVEMKDQALV